MTDIVQEVALAERRIRAFVRETPLEESTALPYSSGARVFLKCENLQHTGSFKVRGALNKVLSLSSEEVARGVVTASTGNHGAAVAFALRRIGATGTVFVPQGASSTKLAAIERQGGTIRVHGLDSSDTEAFAREYALRTGATYISPYNDLQVAGGQGTIAVELLRQLDHFDAVFVSVGGGGWGPLVTGTFIKNGHTPRYVIGSSTFAKCILTVASAITFIFTIGIHHWNIVAGLLIGGIVTAPFSAMLTSKLPTKKMFIAVGIVVIFCSLITIYRAIFL